MELENLYKNSKIKFFFCSYFTEKVEIKSLFCIKFKIGG